MYWKMRGKLDGCGLSSHDPSGREVPADQYSCERSPPTKEETNLKQMSSFIPRATKVSECFDGAHSTAIKVGILN